MVNGTVKLFHFHCLKFFLFFYIPYSVIGADKYSIFVWIQGIDI